MMPYTGPESDWLSLAANAAPRDAVPEVVRRYRLEAEYRRAEAMSTVLVKLLSLIGRAVGRLCLRPGQPARTSSPAVDLREALHQPLTSIRSLTEILRDNPGIPADQHERFLAIIIEESQRLNQLVVQFLERAEAHGRAPRNPAPANDDRDAAA